MTEHILDILLVEDNPADAELTLRALQNSDPGPTVEVVGDGAEALDFLFHEGAYAGVGHGVPRLILLDLKLPKTDGLEVLLHMRADARTRHIPVVMLTSSAEDRDLIEAYRRGVNSYVVKPFNFRKGCEVMCHIVGYWLHLNEYPKLEALWSALRRPAGNS